MKRPLRIKIIVLVVLATIFTIQLYSFYKKNTQIEELTFNPVKTQEILETNVPELSPNIRKGSNPGWSLYVNTDWGMEIEFPSEWMLSERRVTVEYNREQRRHGASPRPLGQLLGFSITNNDYTIIADRDAGSGLPIDKIYERYEYIIAGQKTQIIEDNSGVGFSQFTGIQYKGHDYGFRIYSKTSELKDVTNKILSSVVFR